MKKILKFLAVFTIILSFTSCDEKEWLAPDIEVTTVYSVTNIETGLGLVKINVYKEKSLIIEYETTVVLKNYTYSNFVDSSTATDIVFLVNKITADGTVSYAVSADKTSGVGTLTVDDTSVYTINVSEIQVYN